MIKVICSVCKKSFWAKPYRAKRNCYCSHKCYAVSKKGKPFPCSMLGTKHSEETKLKMSISHKGINTWSKGRKQSKSHKKNISKSLKQKYIGSNRWNYKNGRVIKDGYILIINPNRFNGDKRRYILEHRFVMTKHIGRPLKKQEIVHHINGIKTDNRLNNLMLFPNASAHMNFHLLVSKMLKT